MSALLLWPVIQPIPATSNICASLVDTIRTPGKLGCRPHWSLNSGCTVSTRKESLRRRTESQEKYLWYSRIISATLNRRKQENGGPDIRDIGLWAKAKILAAERSGHSGCISFCTKYGLKHLACDALSGVLRSPRCVAREHNSTHFGFLLSNFLSYLPASLSLALITLRSPHGVQDRLLTLSSSMSLKRVLPLSDPISRACDLSLSLSFAR